MKQVQLETRVCGVCVWFICVLAVSACSFCEAYQEEQVAVRLAAGLKRLQRGRAAPRGCCVLSWGMPSGD